MRFILVASLLALAGCSSHKAQTATDPHSHAHGDVHLASTAAGAGGCHGAKAEMASAEGKQCSSKKVEMASAEGSAHCSAKKAELASADGAAAHCSSKKVEMASAEGSAHCASKKAELASSEGKQCSAKKVELASAAAHPACDDCPKKADGSCDHEAGAKAGKECCKNHLAEATATP